MQTGKDYGAIWLQHFWKHWDISGVSERSMQAKGRDSQTIHFINICSNLVRSPFEISPSSVRIKNKTRTIKSQDEIDNIMIDAEE